MCPFGEGTALLLLVLLAQQLRVDATHSLSRLQARSLCCSCWRVHNIGYHGVAILGALSASLLVLRMPGVDKALLFGCSVMWILVMHTT